MTTSTSESMVTFQRPFTLAGMKEELPAGDYLVETDEELLEGGGVFGISPSKGSGAPPKTTRSSGCDRNGLGGARRPRCRA
jgi:hypothetical protein